MGQADVRAVERRRAIYSATAAKKKRTAQETPSKVGTSTQAGMAGDAGPAASTSVLHLPQVRAQ